MSEEVSAAQTWSGGGQPPPGWCKTTARFGEGIPQLHLAPATAHLGLGIQFGLPGTEKAQKVSSARKLGAGTYGKIDKEKLVLLREFLMSSPDTQQEVTDRTKTDFPWSFALMGQEAVDELQ